VLSEWTDTYNFFMDKKNLHVIRQTLKDEKQVIWKSAKSQIPGKRDLLFSIFQLTTKDKSPIIAALMYKTEELSSRFSTVLQFSKPLVTILTANNQIVTPLKTSDTASIAAYLRIGKEVEKLVINWNKEPSKKAKSYSFTTADKVFWTRIDSISPQNGVEGFAVTVAEDDILATISRIDRTYLYLSFICFAISLIFFVLYRLKTRNKMISKELQPMSDDTLKSLIRKGETEYVEFKSSLRWDYREEKPNKVLEEVILKSIAAFANAKGGTLFIGVNDDLEVIGLEADFNTLKKKDVDYFELHLRKLINNQYGIKYSNRHILMQFPEIDGKTICVIRIAPGTSPLYVKTKNKQGQPVEKFYVRLGNASHEMTSLQEIHEYIETRFRKNV